MLIPNILLPGLPKHEEEISLAEQKIRQSGLQYKILKPGEEEKYLGIGITHDGFTPSIPKRAENLIARLHNWPLRYISPVGKAGLIKSYVYSTLSHAFPLEPLKRETVKALEELEKKAVEIVINGKQKVRTCRLQATKGRGGLKLPHLQLRYLTAKAAMLERAIHLTENNAPLNGAQLYMKYWIKELRALERQGLRVLSPHTCADWPSLQVSSRLLHECILAWKEIQRIGQIREEKLAESPKVKAIYSKMQSAIDEEALPTAKQVELLDRLSQAEKERLWRSSLHGIVGAHKSTTWRFLHSLLPYKRSHPRDKCPRCSLRNLNNPSGESAQHIFFDCPQVKEYAKELEEAWAVISKTKRDELSAESWWSLKTLTGALTKGDKKVISWIHAWMWVIWFSRNRAKWDNTLIQASQARTIMEAQVKRVVAAEKTLLLSKLMALCTSRVVQEPQNFQLHTSEITRILEMEGNKWEELLLTLNPP